jgi:signal transduction histidine kinase
VDNLGHAGAGQLRRLVAAVLGIGADLDLAVVLRTITETATELVGATYGALGVLDPTGTHLSDFITVGLTEEQRVAIGELPKGHGILGLLIVEPKPIRLPDLNEHPDSYGFPPDHPPMTSFLGVPLFVRGRVFGNLYLTDKQGGEVFTDVDEELAMGLAAAAAVAIDNARLHARVRELDVIEDRERIARDLHDTVIQRLFATGLSLQGASRLVDRPEARARIEAAVDDLDTTVREIRTAIFELQAPAAPGHSLRRRLLAVGDELVEALGSEPTFRFEGPVDSVVGGDVAGHVVAVVREGLTNAAKHADGGTVRVSVSVGGGSLEVVIDDDGPGPGPSRVGGHGLANLATRAGELGGDSALEPGAAGGARLRWRVPLPVIGAAPPAEGSMPPPTSEPPPGSGPTEVSAPYA